MAKIQGKTSFSGAVITKENGAYMITEFSKDDAITYNLSEVIDDYLDKDDVSLSISVNGSLAPINSSE